MNKQIQVQVHKFYTFVQTDRPIEKYDDDDDNDHHHYENHSETSLAIVDELKCNIPQEHLTGVVIENRFLVQDLIGDGYTGSVRSGKIKE